MKLSDEQIKYLMSFITDMADNAVSVLHGKQSIDYVLGYQRCAKDMIESAQSMIELLDEEEPNATP